MRVQIVFVLLAAVACVAASKPSSPRTVAELFAMEENIEILRRPDMVDACVLSYIPPPKGANQQEERYEETEYLGVPKEVAVALQTALIRESTYGWDIIKPCWPRYHTRLRFHQKDKTVSIDFCFDCRILTISRDGVPVGGEDFKDPIFLSSMRELFPNDKPLKKARG